MKKKKEVICENCKTQSQCCRLGAWIDLEEAKNILSLGIKGADFFHLEKDENFPSGYKVGTSYEDEPCVFMTRGGLCAIHKISYDFKPVTCKEFPYEDGELAPIARYLCEEVKAKHKKKRKRAR
ncbi:MAG: YkgJ family cysteine cluster protein [Candidatus Omnitrophica bacterium]|nr:YkgJ family cysteine cluster protein [Candidatus Omnitrophota bacterium]